MSNSPLATYAKLSPNHSGKRTHSIDRITPHCVVGQLTAEAIAGCFASPSRQASCNYGIGKDGRIALIVDEGNRSWCSSNAANDQRAVTIECASDKASPYAMNTLVYGSLADLCEDVCRRNGKDRLLWLGGREQTLGYSPKEGEMVLTAHRWFKNKSCPGDWLYSRLGALASEVTARLNDGGGKKPKKYYRVRLRADDQKTQKGSFSILENAKKCADENPGYSVYDPEGNVLYRGRQDAEGEFKFKVTVNGLNIRKGPGTDYPRQAEKAKRGVYTIVRTSRGIGAGEWGLLKTYQNGSDGWIAIDSDFGHRL